MPEQTIKRNHMAIPWHDYIQQKQLPITQASLSEKASVIGRIGLMLLSCGTGAWRVRSSMNTISECLGVVCSADIGLMSVEYTCFDGTESFSQSLCLTNTGVNTSKLNRLERFVADFPEKGLSLTGEQLHSRLDDIEQIHGLYSPLALGFAVRRIYVFARRLSVGNVLCLSRRRCRQHDSLQADQASLHAVFVHCHLGCGGVPDIRRLSAAGRDVFGHFLSARSRLYLFHAVYRSRFSVYHERH